MVTIRVLSIILSGVCISLCTGQDRASGLLFILGGPSWTDVATTRSTDHSSRTAGCIGAGYLHRLTPHFSLGFGLMFEEKGMQLHSPYIPDPAFGILIPQEIPITYALSYLGIPVIVRYTSRSKWHPIGEAGLSPAWLLKAEYDEPIVSVAPNGDWNVIGRRTRKTELYRPFDFVAIVGLGLGCKLTEKVRGEVIGRYSLGLLSIQDGGDAELAAMYNRSFSVMFGINYILNL